MFLFSRSFLQLIGDLSELHEKEYHDLSRAERSPSRNSANSDTDPSMSLSED